MEDTGGKVNPKEGVRAEHWSFETFKVELTQAITHHPPLLKFLPKAIDTGVFGLELDQLLD